MPDIHLPRQLCAQERVELRAQGDGDPVIAKFVPGLATLAPPLAGALGMRAQSFAIFDSAGAALWAGSGIAGGLLFHNQIRYLLEAMSDLGRVAVRAVAALAVLYVAWRVWRRWREARSHARIARVRPGDAQIITYCDCPNDASASKAAHLLAKRGLSARVLAGGLGGWVRAGYPLESV